MIWMFFYEPKPIEVMPVLSELLKLGFLPGLLIAAYFGFLKYGHKVGASHRFSANRIHAEGISSVVLTNLKDRSTPIFGLYAVQGNVVVELVKFDMPLVLKSFDSVKVDIPPVSEYFVDGKRFKFAPSDKPTAIYFSTMGKMMKCKWLATAPGDPAKAIPRRWFEKVLGRRLTNVTMMVERYNGEVYSPNVIYIVDYILHDGAHTAFIDAGGLIYWNLPANMISPDFLEDGQAVADSLMAALPFVRALSVTKASGWDRRFKHSLTATRHPEISNGRRSVKLRQANETSAEDCAGEAPAEPERSPGVTGG